MARGRFISRTVSTDMQLNSVSRDAHLFYLQACPHLDRDGLIIGHPIILAAQVMSARVEEFLPMAHDLVQEWIASGLVIAYNTEKHGRVLWFKGFTKNQHGMRYEREGASNFPPPPGMIRTDDGLVPDTASDNAGVSPDEVRTYSVPHPAQGQGQVQGQVEVQVQDKDKDKETEPEAQAPQTHVNGQTPDPGTDCPYSAYSRNFMQLIQFNDIDGFLGSVPDAAYLVAQWAFYYHSLTEAGKKGIRNWAGRVNKNVRAGTRPRLTVMQKSEFSAYFDDTVDSGSNAFFDAIEEAA